MQSPFEANFTALRSRSLSQFNNWPLYQSVLRHQLGQSVHPFTSQLAGELEKVRLDDTRILGELTDIYKTSRHAHTYYAKHQQEKLRLPDVFRFETILKMHKDLLTVRNQLAGGDPVPIDELRWMEGIIKGAGWLSGNFGIAELAGNIASAVNVVHSRHPSADLEEAGRILNQITATSAYHDADASTAPNGFSRRLLTSGLEIFARLNRVQTIDEAMLARWARSTARQQIIPDIIRSGATIPTETLLKALKTEWKHYNEYLMRQYDTELREPYPEVAFYNYTYTEGDEDHRAIYNETWDAYDLIYGLETAAATLGSSNPALIKAFSERFSFLSQLVSEYASRIKRGEMIHSRFGATTTKLSETPELEELYVLAKALGGLAPKDVGQEVFDFICKLVKDEQLDIQDRGYMLWRMEELFDTTNPLGMNEYVEFSVQVPDIIAMEPQVRRNISECKTFAERVARQWATREVQSLVSKIQDVEIASSTRIVALHRLKRWGAAAEEALPVLAQFKYSLPEDFDLENDTLSSGAHALFKKTRLTSTILTARAVHSHIQSSMEMKGWK